MNKDQRTIYKKIENSDRNCMVRTFPLKEYWLSPTMNWACEGPSVEGQITSVAYVYIVAKVRQRMITLSLFHIGIHLPTFIFLSTWWISLEITKNGVMTMNTERTSYGLINKNREKPRLGKIIFKETYLLLNLGILYLWEWSYQN